MTGMSFLEHLEELRRRIVHSALYVVAGFGICWWFHEKIFAIMQKPIMTALASHHLDTKLVYLNPTDPFNMYLKISALAGLFLASPFVLYQVWAFIAPGLYRNERRYVLPFMFSTVGLFLAGGYFGYRMVYPAALDFLISFSGQFTPMITVGEYTELFLTIIAGLGTDLRDARAGVLPRAHGYPQRRLDVAQLPLCDSGHLRDRGNHYAHARHHEYVRLRRAHGCAVSHQHWDCVVRSSQPAQEARGQG